MINVKHHTDELKVIEEIFAEKTAHPYLDVYIEKPRIDYDVILFLLEIIHSHQVTGKERREQILAALFINAAFFTHERVCNDMLETGERKPRQLTVLAGDFFSSLYYSMLVDNGHVEILPVFSHSIQKINEAKMALHFYEGDSERELMERLYSEEGTLLRNIADFYNESHLGTLAETFFLLKKLVNVRHETTDAALSTIHTAIYTCTEGEQADDVKNWPPENVANFLDRKIMELRQTLTTQLSSSYMKSTALYPRVMKWSLEDNRVWTK